ncbi:class I SAM-dependent rRNA methyltransferase [Telluribacter sp.]|jgi:23S rRNA (cytosine1962-C5)-methyltransferase|uniref:class I SAM-dependent rRNA methyltransferase n=1 Tax=Telluribacter sp. TaxID=1978767 RepID=UPI002E0F5821|nr:class I SAM-dependent rRNA methyltransferase [Telluribacter sp.]
MTANRTIAYTDLPRVVLNRGKEEALKRLHPWVFSGAIARNEGEVQDGDLVQVVSASGQILAIGHFHDGSIKVRILTHHPTDIGPEFWESKLRNAYQARQQLELPATNCYRLVHGEGDGLPGLVVDFYNGVAVLQAHTIGMHRSRFELTEALKKVLGPELKAVYDKSKETLPGSYASGVQNEYLSGEVTLPHRVEEYGRAFDIDWEKGQKTGFFLDQRENRNLLAHYAAGKKVLNAFCYSGGFSVYGLTAKAAEVHSVDISGKAMALCEQNVALNEGEDRHQPITEDVMKWLKTEEEQYDIVVLDPPAFAKSMSARHRAVQGYKRLNAEGLKRVKPGGLLFTFSCSQVVDRELFYNTIVAASMEVGRPVRVLHQLTQGPDHPVNIFHPEGSYLKGLVVRVD